MINVYFRFLKIALIIETSHEFEHNIQLGFPILIFLYFCLVGAYVNFTIFFLRGINLTTVSFSILDLVNTETGKYSSSMPNVDKIFDVSLDSKYLMEKSPSPRALII